jgi:hypothetical protein
MVGEDRRLRHVALGFPTLASDPDLREVSAGSPLVDIKLSPLPRTVGRPIVSEGIPIDVSYVARSAGPHEANGYHGALLFVSVDKLASGQRLSVHQ